MRSVGLRRGLSTPSFFRSGLRGGGRTGERLRRRSSPGFVFSPFRRLSSWILPLLSVPLKTVKNWKTKKRPTTHVWMNIRVVRRLSFFSDCSSRFSLLFSIAFFSPLASNGALSFSLACEENENSTTFKRQHELTRNSPVWQQQYFHRCRYCWIFRCNGGSHRRTKAWPSQTDLHLCADKWCSWQPVMYKLIIKQISFSNKRWIELKAEFPPVRRFKIQKKMVRAKIKKKLN